MKHILIQVCTSRPSPTRGMDYYSQLDQDPYYANVQDGFEDLGAPDQEISAFLQWLEGAKLGTRMGDSSFLLEKNACHELFAPRYKEFRQALLRLAILTTDQFEQCHDVLENGLIDLKRTLEDPFGYYVALDYGAPVPFSWFLRQSSTDQPYFIGSVLAFYD